MTSSYTPKEVTKMVDLYTDNPCLEVVGRLSVLLNRPKKSIISKLVKEGVYIKKGYLSKTGATPITKLQLLRSVEDALDVKLPGLDKAPKTTLKVLSDTVIEQTQMLEDTLEELKNSSEDKRVQDDIFEILNKPNKDWDSGAE
jgi:hypothetical protein